MRQLLPCICVISLLFASAHATIIYSGIINQTCNEFANPLDVDFNHDGNLDVRLEWDQILFGSTSTLAFHQAFEFSQALLLLPDSSHYNYQPAALDYGHMIGPETTGDSSWDHTTLGTLLYSSFESYPPFTETHYGMWNNQVEKYLGCKITIDSVVYYGWIQMSVDAKNNVTLMDYAYENNPNTAIIAGHIPEPASLSLLALGGLFLVRCKR